MSCFADRMQRKQQRQQRQLQQTRLLGEVWACTGCGNPLFEPAAKFDSGTGFPSFWKPIDQQVRHNFLNTYGRERTQLLCNSCGQHLGHLFPNKHTPSGIRYCINAKAILLKNNIPATQIAAPDVAK